VIDLHCHILPALDDGAIDLDDSLAMARQAEADGIRAICATPHIHPDHEISIEELEERVLVLNGELERRGIPVEVKEGGELAEVMVEALGDDDLRRVSLGRNGCWLLLEPRPGPLGAPLVETVETLRMRGFRCVIAHPERHAGADFREQLEALVAREALIQVTAALVAEGPAAPTMLEMARHGLVHLLGSDAHSSRGGRPVELSAGLARLAELDLMKPHTRWVVVDGPEAILNGERALPPFRPGSG
jgi:protein-tyrosine phosphatase